jgi:hypothetical protein
LIWDASTAPRNPRKKNVSEKRNTMSEESKKIEKAEKAEKTEQEVKPAELSDSRRAVFLLGGFLAE